MRSGFHVLNSKIETHPIKEVARHSSRFIYLQAATDGVLSERGTQDRQNGTKTTLLIKEIEKIAAKKESALVYFEYYSSLEVVERMLYEKKLPIKILKSTGTSVLSDKDVTEASVKTKSHIILCTRAASESSSYYFMNNVILFHVPTTPSTFTQMVGRITRKNTLFMNDLHVHIFRSENIDLYKLILISIKSYQMELVSGEELSIPNTYKHYATQKGVVSKLKKMLLWEN